MRFSPLQIEEGSATAVHRSHHAVLNVSVLSKSRKGPRQILGAIRLASQGSEEFQSSPNRGRVRDRPCETLWSGLTPSFGVSVLSKSRKGPRRGCECALLVRVPASACFSPLQIEEGSATILEYHRAHRPREFQSSPNRGRVRDDEGEVHASPLHRDDWFQSSPNRGRVRDTSFGVRNDSPIQGFQSSPNRGRVRDPDLSNDSGSAICFSPLQIEEGSATASGGCN